MTLRHEPQQIKTTVPYSRLSTVGKSEPQCGHFANGSLFGSSAILEMLDVDDKFDCECRLDVVVAAASAGRCCC
jgi:hypothetical protein